jgi:hypothetical protein
MSRALTPGEVKALFRLLVEKAGGIEASGVVLGVSFQRVSTLQNVNQPDMPTLAQIMALEVVAGVPVITGAAARAIEGERAADIADLAVAVVTSGAKTLRLVHDMDRDGKRDTAEIRDFTRATQEHLSEAQALADAAKAMTPTGGAA